MRAIIFLFFINIFAVTAAAQNQPYHVFEYDMPAAHYDQDDNTISNRLFDVGKVAGDLMINECTKHEDYMSGIRFVFNNKKDDKTQTAMFALKCDVKTGAMYVTYILRIKTSSGEFEYIEDKKNRVHARVGTRVPVSVQLHDNTVTFIVGNQSFVQKLNFDVKEIELIGIGSKGVARFFEENLVS